jgi:hypothetical protein
VIELGDGELIGKIIASLTQDNEALMEQLRSIQYWTRGAVSREDVFLMSPDERDGWIDWINKRFKDAADLIKKSIPVFL